MRDNSNDKTVERSYVQKWRFLIGEYQLVKAKKHPQFRFVQDFYNFHGTNRQTFAKYYNRFRKLGADGALLPLKRGPKWKSRRTLPFIEQKVLQQRQKGINRYEIYAILKPVLKKHTPAPSTIYAICRRHGLNRLTKLMQHSKRRIIKTRAGELGHLDTHHLARDLVVGSRKRCYLVALLDACTRLAWAEVVADIRSLSVMFATLKSINLLNAEYGVRFEAVITDNGPEMASPHKHPGPSYGAHASGTGNQAPLHQALPSADQREDRAVLENSERGPAGRDDLRVGLGTEGRAAAVPPLLQHPETTPGTGWQDPTSGPAISVTELVDIYNSESFGCAQHELREESRWLIKRHRSFAGRGSGFFTSLRSVQNDSGGRSGSEWQLGRLSLGRRWSYSRVSPCGPGSEGKRSGPWYLLS